MPDLTYDVVIVGAGPAGSAAARAAAGSGLTVLLIDKRAEVGLPVQCAEYVPWLIRREIALPPGCVAFNTTALRTHLPGGESHIVTAPGHILHRALFDKHLAITAVQAGAHVWLQSPALERTERGLLVRRGGREQEVRARIIVGADGVNSTVGRWIGQRNLSFVRAAQCELVANFGTTHTEVYFAPEYTAGYAWLFPKGETANVGVGVEAATANQVSHILERFLERLRMAGRIRGTATVAHTSGFVPVGGLRKMSCGNILLAGDAAGCVHPVTGAGILLAVISGRLAGEAAAEAVQAGDLMLLENYERRCREAFGGAIERGLASRRQLAQGWTEDPEALERLLRRHWVGLEGYGQEDDGRTDGH